MRSIALLAERFDLHAMQDDHPDQIVPAQHRNADQRSKAADLLSFRHDKFRIGEDVRYLNRLPFLHGPAGYRPAAGHDRVGLHVFSELRREAVHCHPSQFAVDDAHDLPGIGFAEPHGRLDQRIEHGLQVEGRSADHLEHFCGRGLLLERLGQFERSDLGLVVETAELPGCVVDVGGEHAELVAIGYFYILREVAGRNATKPRLDRLDRPDERPRNDVAQPER